MGSVQNDGTLYTQGQLQLPLAQMRAFWPLEGKKNAHNIYLQ